jgi:hypothetical protein
VLAEQLGLCVDYKTLEVRVARFSLVQQTKNGGKYTKLSQNILIGNKKYQVAVK